MPAACKTSKISRGESVLGGVLEHQKRHIEYHMSIVIKVLLFSTNFGLCGRFQLHFLTQNLQNVLHQSVCSGMDSVDCTLAFAASTPP